MIICAFYGWLGFGFGLLVPGLSVSGCWFGSGSKTVWTI